MPVWIAKTSAYVPRRIVTNDEIIARRSLKMRGSWIEKYVGVRERRWVDDETTSDLAAAAIRGLALTGFEGSLFLSTISPDHPTPSTASIVKRKLGWTFEAPAIDLAAACAGHLFALDLAKARLESSGEREAIVCAAEVRSRFLNPDDRRTVFIFGDGAAAFHLRRTDDAPGEVEWVHSATLPSDVPEILVPAGGSAMPLSEQVLAEGSQFIAMLDGPKILAQTSTLLVDAIRRSLAARRAAVEDYSFFVFHQGNASLGAAVCEALGVPADKTWGNFERFGNTASASLGIALDGAARTGRSVRGDRVLLCAMGAGYHLGLASVRWA